MLEKELLQLANELAALKSKNLELVRSDHPDKDHDRVSCGICFESNHNNVDWNCSHTFCESCSTKWLAQNTPNPTCPICWDMFSYCTKLTLNLWLKPYFLINFINWFNKNISRIKYFILNWQYIIIGILLIKNINK